MTDNMITYNENEIQLGMTDDGELQIMGIGRQWGIPEKNDNDIQW